MTAHVKFPEADGMALPLRRPPYVLDAAGRPLVLAVRDARRQPWQRRLIRRVLAARPDLVVVGTGTTRGRGLAPGRYIGTRGAGRVNLEAAADLLTGTRR